MSKHSTVYVLYRLKTRIHRILVPKNAATANYAQPPWTGVTVIPGYWIPSPTFCTRATHYFGDVCCCDEGRWYSAPLQRGRIGCDNVIATWSITTCFTACLFTASSFHCLFIEASNLFTSFQFDNYLFHCLFILTYSDFIKPWSTQPACMSLFVAKQCGVRF